MRNKISKAVRKLVWDMTGGKCWYCGRQCEWVEEGGGTCDSYSIDHIIPVSCGGLTEYGNIVPCCKSCNSTKRNRSLEDLRLHMSQAGNPEYFTRGQIDYLKEEFGFELPLKKFKFYYETMYEEEESEVNGNE